MAFRFCCILTFINISFYICMLLEKNDADKSFEQTNWFLMFTISSLAIFVLLFTIKYVKSLAILIMPLNALQSMAIFCLYSFEETMKEKSTLALFSIVIVSSFQMGLQTHYFLSIIIFFVQVIVAQGYIWNHYDGDVFDQSEFGVTQTMLQGLSISLAIRELILSTIAFFYERAVYAFFKEQVQLERKYMDLK